MGLFWNSTRKECNSISGLNTAKQCTDTLSIDNIDSVLSIDFNDTSRSLLDKEMKGSFMMPLEGDNTRRDVMIDAWN